MLVFTKDALHACTENVRIRPDVRMCTYRCDAECLNSALSLHRNSGVILRSAG